MAQAVPLRWSVGAGARLKKRTPGPWVSALGTGRVLHLLLARFLWPPRGRTGRSRRWTPPKSLLHPLHPTAGTAKTTGSTEIRRLEELGAEWPQGKEVVSSAGALQSCSVQGHEKYSGFKLLKRCWSSVSGFSQLILMIKLKKKKTTQTQLVAGAHDNAYLLPTPKASPRCIFSSQ